MRDQEINYFLGHLPLTKTAEDFLASCQDQDGKLIDALNDVLNGAIKRKVAQRLAIDPIALNLELTRATLTHLSESRDSSISQALNALASEACGAAESTYSSCANYAEKKAVGSEFISKAKVAAHTSHLARMKLNDFFSGDGRETAGSVLQAFVVQKTDAEVFCSDRSKENIELLKQGMLNDLRTNNENNKQLTQAKINLALIKKNKTATALTIAQAEANVQLFQDALDFKKYEQYQQNFSHCIQLLSMTRHLAAQLQVPKVFIDLLSGTKKIATGVQAAHTLFWNIGQYTAVAAASGPLAPIVAIAGAVATLYDLYENWGKESGPTDRVVLMSAISAVFDEVRASRNEMHAMVQGLAKLIREKDGLDQARHVQVIECLTQLNKNILGELINLSNEVQDSKILLSRLGEKLDQARADWTVLFSDNIFSEYKAHCNEALTANSKSTTPEQMRVYWTRFGTYLTDTFSSSTFSTPENASPNLNIKIKIEFQIQKLGVIARQQGISFSAPLPHPTLWANGMLNTMEYVYRLKNFEWTESREYDFRSMRQGGERIRDFIIKIKTTPEFLATLTQQYLDQLIAVQDNFRKLKGDRVNFLLLLKPHVALGQRFLEKQVELTEKNKLVEVAQLEVNRCSEINQEETRILNAAKAELAGIESERAALYPTPPFGVPTNPLDLVFISLRENSRESIALRARVYRAHVKMLQCECEQIAALKDFNHAIQNRDRLSNETTQLKNDVERLDTEFSALYDQDKSDHEIFLEYVSHLSPDEKQKFNQEIFKNCRDLSASRNSLRDALNKLEQAHFCLRAFLHIAFRDHKEIQLLFQPMQLESCFDIKQLNDAKTTVYQNINDGLMPSFILFRTRLLRELVYAKRLADQGQNIPLTNDLIETVFKRIDIFEHVMELRKKAMAYQQKVSRMPSQPVGSSGLFGSTVKKAQAFWSPTPTPHEKRARSPST